ncbi:MAG TPA: glycosyltransferase, partial [Polyangia bacterium]|nr:glycosyltransferase [Polyangia bacterium]
GCFVEDEVKQLVGAGHEVEVFAAGAAGTDPVRREGALTVWRVQPPACAGRPLFYGEGAPEALERAGLPALSAWAQAAWFWGGLCRALRRRVGHLERLVAHWLVPSAAVALAVAPHLPLRAHAHSGDVALLERWPGGRAMARWLARRSAAANSATNATELLFVTRALRQRFAALVGRPVGRVQTLAAPSELFAPANPGSRQAARRRLGLARPTVISVGRLVPIKGFDLLLTACANVARAQAAGPASPPSLDLDLVILGDGPQRQSLDQRARRLGVRLTLPGFVPRPQVADWLRAADVYVQPSLDLPSGRTEGLPLAVLEALAMGLRVVASQVGGLPELAHQNHGINLVPPGDVAALGRALDRLLGGRPTGTPL